MTWDGSRFLSARPVIESVWTVDTAVSDHQSAGLALQNCKHISWTLRAFDLVLSERKRKIAV